MIIFYTDSFGEGGGGEAGEIYKLSTRLDP